MSVSDRLPTAPSRSFAAGFASAVALSLAIAASGVVGSSDSSEHSEIAQPGLGSQPEVSELMKDLEPLLGAWKVDAQWSWGDTLEARNVYTVGLNGNFVEVSTVVSDNGGPEYVRYHTIYAANPEHATNPDEPEFIGYGFTNDGSVTVLPIDYENGMLKMEWLPQGPGGMTIRQQSGPVTDDEFPWIVQMRQPGQEAWEVVMDAKYQKSVRGEK